jgi:signal peptidase II
VGCDQVTKSAARSYLRTGEEISFLSDTVRLQRAENPGAFLSIGAALPATVRTLIFTSGCALFLGGAMLWAAFSRRMNTIQTAGAALVCGGGVGNLIDRCTRDGYVTDFLNLGIGSMRTGIFNLADVVLLLGLAVLSISGAGSMQGARQRS